MSTAATGGAVAAIVVAAKAAKDRDEEENLTKYNSEDLDGWEFKIVRSELGRFGNREIFQKLCDQESKAGWEMVEKFDNSRIRFKRRVEKRSQDQYLDFDPYRTSISSFSGGAIAAIIGLVVLLGGLVAFFAIGYDVEVTDSRQFGSAAIFVVLTVVLIAALAVIKRRRG